MLPGQRSLICTEHGIERYASRFRILYTSFELLPVSLKIPQAIHNHMLDITEKQARDKLKEEFLKNAHVKDPRAVDLIVVKVRRDDIIHVVNL